jgi:molybdopterin converting factor small subunit
LKVKVELQAYLEEYSPAGRPAFDYVVPEGARVADLITQLGIPHEMATVVIVGQTAARMDDPLHEGDTVTVIPPLAGGAR